MKQSNHKIVIRTYALRNTIHIYIITCIEETINIVRIRGFYVSFKIIKRPHCRNLGLNFNLG